MTKPRISSAVMVEGCMPELPDYLKKNMRRSDEFIQLAVSAVHLALSTLPDLTSNDENIGFFLGTCFGPMQCNFDVLDTLVDDAPVSPTLFSHSVFNAAAGYISRLFSIYGGAWTITSFGWPFLSCLENALMFLDSGRLDKAVVLQAETYSPLLLEAMQRMVKMPPSWNPGAAAWVLETSSPQGTGCCLAKVKVDEGKNNATCYIERNEQVISHPETILADDPLASPRFLTNLVSSAGKKGNQSVEIKACFGSAIVLVTQPDSL